MKGYDYMLDYKTLTAKEIREFLDGKKLAKEQKKEFYAKTHPAVMPKVSKKVFDADGKPVMFQVKTKDKKPKFDNEGNPVMRQKTEMVDKEGGVARPQFSIIEAKNWVVEHYPDEVENAPKKKAEKKDPFEDWA